MSLTSRKDFSLSVGTLTNARSFGKRGWYLLLMHSSPPTPPHRSKRRCTSCRPPCPTRAWYGQRLAAHDEALLDSAASIREPGARAAAGFFVWDESQRPAAAHRCISLPMVSPKEQATHQAVRSEFQF